ncbi:MAG: hypothetical protein ACK5QX_03505 [bacterium]|jgi:hypothetical protein
MRLAALLILIAMASPVVAQEWKLNPGKTSALFASAGLQLSGTAGLSWPDGKQAIVTYWSMPFEGGKHFTVRCVTYFDADFRQTGDICSYPEGGEQ